MTRVEPTPGEQPVGRDEMKKIVRRELFLEMLRRKMYSCLGYLFVLFLIFGTPAAFIAVIGAKSGFMDVPVLSAWLYQPSAPIRTVVAARAESPDALAREISSRTTYEPTTNLLTVSIKESELTALAVTSIRQSAQGSLPFPVRDMQIAVDPGIIEIFATSPHGVRDATVRLRFSPHLTAGKLGLDLQGLRIGSLDVPTGMAQFLVSSLSSFVTDALNKQIAGTGTLADVRAEAGALRIVLVPAHP